MRDVDWRAVTLWAPVVGVAALASTGIGLESPWTGSGLALALAALLLAAPLIVRRDQPLVAAGVVAVAVPVQMMLGGSLGFGTFVAAAVAAYAAGRYAAPASAVACVAAILLGIGVAMREALAADGVELVIPMFYLGAAAGLGALVRRLTAHSQELHRLNAALERERDAVGRLAVATERIRLARDLHDVVAHTLTVAVVQAEVCEEALDQDLGRARGAAREVQQAGRRGLADLRSMVRLLRDAESPTHSPGLDDLGALAAAMDGADLEVTIRREGDLSRVPPDVGGDLFRVAQEALTNVVKHSGAASAVVHVRVGPEEVTVDVTDAGPALGSGLPSGGHGVPGMAERLAAYGGELVAAPQRAGFRVHGRVPLEPLR